MHIVVLFGADPRVIRYAKEVQSTFLENGIDVYLQTEDAGQRIFFSPLSLQSHFFFQSRLTALSSSSLPCAHMHH